MKKWTLPCVVSMVLGCGVLGCGDDEDSCRAENHCVEEDGEWNCEEGYTWEDPNDLENNNCVSEGEAFFAGDGDDDGDSGNDGNEDEEENDTNPDVGPVDSFSQLACNNLEDHDDTVVAATSLAEAAQTVILASASKPFQIQLPETGPGYVTLEVADWMAILRFFANEGVEYEILGGELNRTIQLNGACTESLSTDLRWEFHEWGSYVIRFDAAPENTAWFLVVSE